MQLALFDMAKYKKQSKYKIEETPDGFKIYGKDRNLVQVRLASNALLVESAPDGAKTFGLYEYYPFSREIAQGLMTNWEPPEDYKDSPWPGCREWVVTQTAKAVGKRVYKQWQRLLNKVSPDVLAVQKAIFAATMGAADIARCEKLYNHKYVVRDIINYRAAAIAAANVEELGRRFKLNEVWASPKGLEFSKRRRELETLAEELGFYIRIILNSKSVNDVPFAIEEEDDLKGQIDPEEKIDLLGNWKSLFSPTCEDYRSLNRTLMNLPGGVPHGLVCNLARIYLRRPVFNRSELALLMLYAGFKEGYANKEDVFMFATQAQIFRAMALVGEHTHNQLSPRRIRDIRFLVQFLLDFPENHNGNIVGLTKKSIAWHRDRREAEIQKQVNNFCAETETARPPIPPPDLPEIKFLSTVGEIVEEGAKMEHCIASYIADAIQGYCYLFHVDWNGDSASVQVDWRGEVIQAHGPRNQRNLAVTWGARVLARWGRDFPEELPSANGELNKFLVEEPPF